MHAKYILTAFGKDRPGIVADVTEVLFDNGCNLEDTSMAMLSDEFTINLLFSSNNPQIETVLDKECHLLEKNKQISAFVRPIKLSRLVSKEKLPLCTIHVEGLDQAGIVYKISKHLADNNLNIIDLKSTVKTTPESGTAIYLMDIHIQLPHSIKMNTLEEELNQVAEYLNVEVSVSP